jgi:uncharacterized protein DUF5667
VAAGGMARTRRARPRPAVLVVRAIGMILVTSLAAGASFATEDALPDSPLHDVKIATEQVRLALARSPEHLVAVELDVAAARLHEAAALQAQDRQAEADAAVSSYGEHVASAAAHLEETQSGPQPAQVQQFRAQVVKQLQQTVPATNPPVFGATRQDTALGIASEIAVTIRLDDQVGAPDIAAAAANAATKAATNVERRAPAAPAAEIPASTATAAPQVTAPVTPARNPPATTPVSVSTASVAVTVASPQARVAVPTAQATTSPAQNRQAQPQNGQNEKQKIDSAAAKAAREAADRAQQSADRARQAAEKTARDSADRAKKDKESSGKK